MATPARTSTRLSASARRQQLLDKTTELVIERGFRGVSIEAVSKRAGVTRAVIYQHFDGLQDLLEAAVAREMTRALAQVSETALADLSEGSPRELMLESLRSYLHVVRDHPTTWRLVLMPPEGAPELLQNSITHGRATVLAQLAQAVDPVLSRDRGSPEAELTARILSAISDEYARLVLSDPVRFAPGRLLSHARWLLESAS